MHDPGRIETFTVHYKSRVFRVKTHPACASKPLTLHHAHMTFVLPASAWKRTTPALAVKRGETRKFDRSLFMQVGRPVGCLAVF